MGTQDHRKAQKMKERRVLRARRQHNNTCQSRVGHPALHAQSLACPFMQDSHNSSPALHPPPKNQGIYMVPSVSP